MGGGGAGCCYGGAGEKKGLGTGHWGVREEGLNAKFAKSSKGRRGGGDGVEEVVPPCEGAGRDKRRRAPSVTLRVPPPPEARGRRKKTLSVFGCAESTFLFRSA